MQALQLWLAELKKTWGYLKVLPIIFLAGLLSSCSVSAPEPASDKPQVLATFTVLADIAQSIGGEHIEVSSLTKAGAEIHGYDPTPSDVRQAQKADLILANGLNLEAWLDQFLIDSQAPAVIVTEGIKPLSITEDAGAGFPNPHAWMSPIAAQTYVDNIADAFSELDPENAQSFKTNAQSYKRELENLHQELVSSLETLPETQRMLVTCEGAFSYLAADAGLTETYLWAVNSDGETGAKRISEVIAKVKQDKVPAVFCETTVSSKTMEQIAAESSAIYAGELYVDSLSDTNGPVPTYLDLIRYDTQLIADSLGDSQK